MLQDQASSPQNFSQKMLREIHLFEIFIEIKLFENRLFWYEMKCSDRMAYLPEFLTKNLDVL